jgi:glutamate formiminotransferase
VVDVVPFVPLGRATIDQAIVARNEFAQWLAQEMRVPSFLYGPDFTSGDAPRTLPDIRRQAWKSLRPDWGPDSPHPLAGAVCVGARHPLVAFNIWLRSGSDWSRATEITAALRTNEVRALTLRVASQIQISINLVDPTTIGPAAVYERVRSLAETRHIDIDRAELVGLIPQFVLDAVSPTAWSMLDLSPERTIEYRIAHGYRFRTNE